MIAVLVLLSVCGSSLARDFIIAPNSLSGTANCTEVPNFYDSANQLFDVVRGACNGSAIIHNGTSYLVVGSADSVTGSGSVLATNTNTTLQLELIRIRNMQSANLGTYQLPPGGTGIVNNPLQIVGSGEAITTTQTFLMAKAGAQVADTTPPSGGFTTSDAAITGLSLSLAFTLLILILIVVKNRDKIKEAFVGEVKVSQPGAVAAAVTPKAA